MSQDPTIVQHAELGERLDPLAFAWRHEGMPEVEKLFEELLDLSSDDRGVTRAAYTPSESAALDLVERIARKISIAGSA